jgi:hypothetical protein
VLLASEYANQRAEDGAAGASAGRDTPVQLDDLRRAARDYLPPRDLDMLEFMELLAVFEASNRRMLPPKYANMQSDELQARLNHLKLTVGLRR